MKTKIEIDEKQFSLNHHVARLLEQTTGRVPTADQVERMRRLMGEVDRVQPAVWAVERIVACTPEAAAIRREALERLNTLAQQI